MIQLVQKEIENLLIFLARVDLKGNESEAHVEVKYKLSAMLNELKAPPVVEEVPIEEPVKPLMKEVGDGKK